MKKINNTKYFTVIGLLLWVLLATACGANPATKLNQQGNDAYAEQAYLEALELYQNAQVEHPELAQPYYNAANAFYREGQYEQALAQMQQALLYADSDLAQHSYFNLGNNFFNAQDMATAVQSYIEALLLNPDDADAKYNLELALNQQQQEQEEQQQEQEQEQEQNQDEQQQDQNGGEGQDEQEQSGENGDQQPQDQQGEQPQDGQEGQDQQGDQPQDGQEGQDGEQNQDGQPQPGQPGDQPGTQAGLQPGQKLSQEQAEQLLAAIAGNSQTLQEKLGQILVVPGPPPAQDW